MFAITINNVEHQFVGIALARLQRCRRITSYVMTYVLPRNISTIETRSALVNNNFITCTLHSFGFSKINFVECLRSLSLWKL